MSAKKRKPLPTWENLVKQPTTHEGDEPRPWVVEYLSEPVTCVLTPFGQTYPRLEEKMEGVLLFPITSVVIFGNEVVLHTLRCLTSYNSVTCIHTSIPDSYDKNMGGMDRIHGRHCFVNHKEGMITVITVFTRQGLLEVLRENRFHQALQALEGIQKSLRENSGHLWNRPSPPDPESLMSSSLLFSSSSGDHCCSSKKLRTEASLSSFSSLSASVSSSWSSPLS
jgi:hypothetical protein